jgi:hypothetical protein
MKKTLLSILTIAQCIIGFAQTNTDPSKLTYVKSEFEINYSILNKTAKAEMSDIHDWLNQFTLISDNEVSYYDAELAKLYGSDDPRDSYGRIFFNTKTYKEGIVLVQKGEHEGASFEMFIPLLNLADAKRIVDRLCRNMGGCLKPQEVNVDYEQVDHGIKVYWGGGC